MVAMMNMMNMMSMMSMVIVLQTHSIIILSRESKYSL